MQRFLTTPDINGTFDFFSNTITLNKFEAKHKDIIDNVISGNTSTFSPQQIIDAREIKSLLIHETTHFLDTTTTLWGVEYTYRKMRVADGIKNNKDITQPLDVFHLNAAELEMHRELLVVSPTSKLADCTSMNHSLIYHEKYGAIIMIHYMSGNERIHQTPLSMLSIIEANAYSNELLAKIYDINNIPDPDERAVSLAILEKEMAELINDPNLTEYTVLIKLAQLHLPELNPRELLTFVSALARFTLDIGTMTSSALANPIYHSFQNQYIGDAICTDMRRGASRYIVFFKTLLLMYGWMHAHINSEEKEAHLTLLRNSPREAIIKFWNEFGVEVEELAPLDELELSMGIKRLCKLSALQDGKIISESVAANRRLLTRNPPGKLELKDLKLLNILLADDSEIRMPNRIEIDVVDYINENIGIFSKLDALYRQQEIKKFHIPPGTPIFHMT